MYWLYDIFYIRHLPFEDLLQSKLECNVNLESAAVVKWKLQEKTAETFPRNKLLLWILSSNVGCGLLQGKNMWRAENLPQI